MVANQSFDDPNVVVMVVVVAIVGLLTLMPLSRAFGGASAGNSNASRLDSGHPFIPSPRYLRSRALRLPANSPAIGLGKPGGTGRPA